MARVEAPRRRPRARHAVREHVAEIRDRVLDKAQLEVGETLLDVGCGDGLIGFGAMKRLGTSGRVIFTDVSSDVLQLCREHAQEAGVLDSCLFLQAPADRLRAVADGAVHAVTTRSVLIYVADKQRSFDEFHRVLRSQGRLSVWEPINAYPDCSTHTDSSYCGYDVAPVAELAAKVKAVYEGFQPRASDPMLNFDERDLLRAAQRSGFKDVHLKLSVDIEPRLPPVTWELRPLCGQPVDPYTR